MKFIGRTAELNRLKKEFASDEMRMALIYGRRRVGKSELIKEAIKESEIKSIYYECKQVTEASNVQSICDVISEAFGLPKLGYSSIEDLINYVFTLSENENLIFVLDEYPYLRENVKGLDSIIQSLVDKYRDSAKLKFVILGSYVDIMKSLIEHSNPLFGRVDLVIDLKQMDYFESAQFYPDMSDKDKVRIYSVFGGIPYFNRLIDDSKSVKENIIDLIASPGARLENEVSMYLNAEISKIVNANEVFYALSKGASRYSDILSQSHVSSGPTMVDVLDKLIKMEVVEKTAPINDEDNKKKAGYYICDNLSLFYYRYIFKYSSQLQIMDSDIFYDKYIADDFEKSYVPHKFEEVCKQYLIRQNRLGKITPVIEKIGKYYYDDPKTHTNGEFDVVTLDEKGYVFYEVKFRKKKISREVIEEEIHQVQATGLKRV
ncbi:MAG: ATP-binding protein [Lachnospiraceae bacterium]|uniref:ATP-binding protein n=1 Tax=Candidatus Weimeria bifida TaxID=2599074 RepID=A0A6N7IY48_9FIRM|nr:ATP-binding protein [Candidatus Weimeria bifida]RRF94770.1 MAG: ATP-binding protein [Lachnospiraceae bacterium]